MADAVNSQTLFDGDSQAVSAPTSSTSPLLIVADERREVPQSHDLKLANVNPEFESC